jgi:hypothetical protein
MWVWLLIVFVVFGAGIAIGRWFGSPLILHAQGRERVFELRTYTAMEGKHADLLARFRDHSTALFDKHGITNVGYWVPQDSPGSSQVLTYLLAFPSRSDAKERWAAFLADPEWQQVRTASEVNGKLVARIESVYLEPTDFSPLS